MMQTILERDWLSFNVENFIRYFERLKLESTADQPCNHVLLVLNRSNYRHVDRLMLKIHKERRSLPVKIKIVRDSLWRQYEAKHGR